MLFAHCEGYEGNYRRLKTGILNEVQHPNGSISVAFQHVENEFRLTALRVL